MNSKMIRKISESFLKSSVNDCKSYRRDLEICITGCREEKILHGGYCRYIDEQQNCKCYRKR